MSWRLWLLISMSFASESDSIAKAAATAASPRSAEGSDIEAVQSWSGAPAGGSVASGPCTKSEQPLTITAIAIATILRMQAAFHGGVPGPVR
ncbi:MAG TPA: hypothetical protein VH165_34015 [Kofleriaceae bacterium]|nr:hypothetical protein [Kofleriaceae bacterium]